MQEVIREKLDSFDHLPPIDVLRPGGSDLLPVFAAVRATVVYLGHAATHGDAQTLGLQRGISCERSSRATLTGDCRKFFVLHQ